MEQHRRRHRERAASSRCRRTRRRHPLPASRRNGRGDHASRCKWYGGYWAHIYDVYFGTIADSAARCQRIRPLGPSKSETGQRSDLRPARARCRRARRTTGASSARRWRNKTSDEPGLELHDGGRAPRRRRRHRRAPATSSSTPPTAPVRVGRVAASRPTRPRPAARGWRNPNASAAKITHRSRNPANYFEMTFNARGRARLSALDARQGATATTGRTIRSSCSSRTRSRHRARRPGASARHRPPNEPRGLQRLRRVGLGLAGQRLGHRRDGPAGLLRDDRARRRMRVQIREDGLSIDQIVLSHDDVPEHRRRAR